MDGLPRPLIGWPYSVNLRAMADRILVIDDDARLARMLAEYLGQQGFEVRVRGDARSGLEAAAKEAFDLILLDVMLPGRTDSTCAASCVRPAYRRQSSC